MRLDVRIGVGSGVAVGAGPWLGVEARVGEAIGSDEGVGVGSVAQETSVSRRSRTTVSAPGDFMAEY